jgi:hypothetical protein
MKTEAHENHRWLAQLVGDWESEMESDMGPDKPKETHRGSESVRMLGDLWLLMEGTGEMPAGGKAGMLLTLGFDPSRGRFVGTWVGSMMDRMWVYEGQLDAERKILTLDTEGPDMSAMTGDCGVDATSPPLPMAKYQDIIEVISPDQRQLRSHFQDKNGEWQQFMVANYRRVKP